MTRTLKIVLCLAFLYASGVAQSLPSPIPTGDDSKSNPTYESNRKYALEVFDQKRLLDALPLLEQLAAQNPKDMVVMERLGMSILASSVAETNPEKRKATRIRARETLMKAQALGDNSQLLVTLLEGIAPDGSGNELSDKADVDAAMREGEAAYAAGDLEKAIPLYQHTLSLDPNNYFAALFIGDCYFKLNKYDKAGEWFAKAIKIDPDIETAYRYWGDSLMAEGKMAEARTNFIESYIVKPYTQSSGFALQNWAKANNVQIGHPRIQSPNAVEAKDDKNINITINASSLDAKDGSSAWMLYDILKTTWRGDKFKKEFPNEKEYRHSLREEAEGLNMVADSVEMQIKSKKIKNLDPSLATLVKLKNDGLIEPFVLLAKADNGIAQDYPQYLKDHRDKLRKYMGDYVVPAPKSP